MAQPESRGDGQRKRRQRRKGRRRWCLPPPIIREPGEMLEGSYVLAELPPDRALLCWTAVRDVTLWGGTPPEQRAALFSPPAETASREAVRDARLEPVLDLSLATLATVVSHAAQADPEIISRVCLQVARWARDHGAMGTAVAFAQAAAFANPDAAPPALAAGRLALEWGRDRRADTWLRRAIGLARRAGEWESYGGAYLALGEVYERAGGTALAVRAFTQAARLARRQGFRELRGDALHGLLRTSLAAGELDAANDYGRLAQRCYGPDHPRLPGLHYDVARLRVARGQHDRAVPLLRRLIGALADPAKLAVCHALLAHATAALGEAALYERSWTEAWALLDAPAAAPSAAEVLRHLGKAAALLGDWLRVQQVVEGVTTARDVLPAASHDTDLNEIRGLLNSRRTGNGRHEPELTTED
jgi:tetratricopeptide (TPR) repeat protein